MLRIIVAALAAASPIYPATASYWKLLSKDEGVETYIDTDSFTTFDNSVKAWIRRDHPAETSKKKTRTSKWLLRVDCRDRTYALLAFTDYDIRGEVLASGSTTPELASQVPIATDSTSSALFQMMCSARTKPD